ncbi:hypothetical protein HK101_007132, partial [Irineochytrium annulatum]
GIAASPLAGRWGLEGMEGMISGEKGGRVLDILSGFPRAVFGAVAVPINEILELAAVVAVVEDGSNLEDVGGAHRRRLRWGWPVGEGSSWVDIWVEELL